MSGAVTDMVPAGNRETAQSGRGLNARRLIVIWE